ncbi:MAG: hypothetical protein LBD41_01940 [Clostridiales Family XIII bacterium]|jgi:hypothetical protein|nr:hypothetical protein [Clostridiales Family XIII bacterium]
MSRQQTSNDYFYKLMIRQVFIRRLWIYDYIPCKLCCYSQERDQYYLCSFSSNSRLEKQVKKQAILSPDFIAIKEDIDNMRLIDKYVGCEPFCKRKSDYINAEYKESNLVKIYEIIPCKFCSHCAGYDVDANCYFCTSSKTRIKKRFKHGEPGCKNGVLI